MKALKMHAMSGSRSVAAIGALSALLLTVSLARTVVAGDWRQFRGPFDNGSTDEKNLPGVVTSANIAWTADLPGPSAATPIVVGDRVFVASSDPETKELLAIAIDRKTGKQLWRRKVAEGLQRDARSNYASCSPASNGELVVFFFGNGPLTAFSLDGKELWARDLVEDYGDFAFMWTFSTSPVLDGDRLYLQVLQRDTPVDGRGFSDRPNDSYLLCLDAKTGKERWRHVRPSEARAESREAFTTPVVATLGGKRQLLVIGGDDLTGHDLESGEELWRWGTWNPERIGHWRHVPSPVAGAGIVLVCAPKRDPIYAIRPAGKGKLDDDAIAWVSREARELSSDVPTPAFAEGDFFVLSDVRKSLSRVDPRTGKSRWTTDLPGNPKYEASPLVADGKIYVINFHGELVTLDAKSGQLLSVFDTDATREYPVRSSVVAAHGQLFVRTNRKLFAIGAASDGTDSDGTDSDGADSDGTEK